MIELIGYLGMILVLLTLVLARKHFFKSQIVSLIGGILLAAKAYFTPNAEPFLILNSIWTVVSIYNLLKARGDKAVKTSS